MPNPGGKKPLTVKPGIFEVLGKEIHKRPWLPVCLLLIGIAGAFGCSYLYNHIGLEKRHQQASLVAENYSQKQALVVNNYINGLQKTFGEFVKRPWIIQALKERDYRKLARLEELLAKVSKDTEKSLVVYPEDINIKLSENYAAREMHSMAELTGLAPHPEAIRYEGKMLLQLITPVKDNDDTYLGSLVTSLRLDGLQELLATASLPGQSSLIQTMTNVPKTTFLRTGAAGTDVTGSFATEVPYWQVEFAGNPDIFNETSINLAVIENVILGLGLIYLALILGLISFAYAKAPRIAITRHENVDHDIEHRTSLLDSEHSFADLKNDASDADESLVVLDKVEQRTEKSNLLISQDVFREYDIRGIADKEITKDFALLLGRALGTLLQERNEKTLITAYDGRLTSPDLYSELEQGLLSTGCSVIELGAVPTPVMNFAVATQKQANSGVMVTASHNPAEYNGFKICLNNRTATSEEIQQIYEIMKSRRFREGLGEHRHLEISSNYIKAVSQDVVPGLGLKVVVDAGNGIAGKIAPATIEELGCHVIPLFCEVDGNFPNHPPDTSDPKNLAPLISAVQKNRADLGIALDGDGDRIVAVSPSGKIIWPDELLMIFARDVLSRQPGADIIYDVKSTRRLNTLINSYSGRPVMWKTGHSNMRTKVQDNDSPLGGEYSGHIFFRDRWHGFDDGIYAAARLIEIISTREQTLDEITSGFERTFATTEIKIPVEDQEKFTLMEAILEKCNFSQATVTTLDGLRVDYPKGWGLVRASNTSPALTLRFEAISEDMLEKLKSLFRQQLSSIDPRLTF